MVLPCKEMYENTFYRYRNIMNLAAAFSIVSSQCCIRFNTKVRELQSFGTLHSTPKRFSVIDCLS